MDFKNIPRQYRPIPFWSWNERLNTEETKSQIHKMHIAGIGGFFMHARGGLQTEYLSDEWFDNVSASIEAAKEYGMKAWAYDENGWPSGFGSGEVNRLGVEYQQKYLRMEVTPEHKETAICQCGGHYFFYEVNPFYVDTLDRKVVAKFIETAYEPYFAKFGNEIEGFFTDEPQISRNGIPWSFVFENEYSRRYNENILEHLEELFLPVGDYRNTRIRFWKMVTDLFSSSYFKQIYEWCSKHGLKLTGHLVQEDNLFCQLNSNGACMPHYEYFHIPGMDWLGKRIYNSVVTQQLGSVAEQLGKKFVLSETFALCGHNISFDELKGIYEWQMVHGINLLCQHLEGYSLRGIRKRDYPPAMYYQQPWWSEYSLFNDAMSREGMLLAEGKKTADVLLIHPQTTAWTLYAGSNSNDDIKELHNKFTGVIKELERKHIPYHLGDETLLERHGKVQNGKLLVGVQSYSYVITECCDAFLDTTKQLLEEFEKNGGKIVSAGDIKENKIIDNANITYKKCEHPDFYVHFFVNTSPKYEYAKFCIRGEKLDIYTGELSNFSGAHSFEPWGSLMLIEKKGADNSSSEEPTPTDIRLPDTLRIAAPIQNCITLDRCDYYFDGILQEKNGYVLNICERANKLEREVKIHQDYHINLDAVPTDVHLACETPEIFTISVNGAVVPKEIDGYFADKSFKKIDITSFLKLGANTISFDCDFIQSPEFYENLKKAYVFESEKNKLTYDIEIEAIYLVGDFTVKTDGEWEDLDNNAGRYKGNFTIDKPVTSLSIKHIEKQGYPFFSGQMVLEGEIDIQGSDPLLVIDRKGVNALKVEINGKQKTIITGNVIDLNQFNAQGKCNIRLTLINNLRNLLGPHHLKNGEIYSVGPASFFKEPCVWNRSPEEQWDDDYCFVEVSL